MSVTRTASSTSSDGGIAWLLSRELLQAGLDGPAGDGDVRLWPAHAATDVLFLHLRAPSGEALFELSRATVAAFLRQTETLVPSGTESALLDLDDELHVAALQRRGRPDRPLTCGNGPAHAPRRRAPDPPALERPGGVG